MHILLSAQRRGVAALLVAVVCFCGFGRAARAQSLADRIPSDALIYVGWTGYETKSPGFEGSHLQAVMAAAQTEQLVNDFLPKLIDRLAQEQPDAKDKIAFAKPIVLPLLKHPTAIFIGKPDMTNPNDPIPHVGILCQAGPEADAMVKQLSDILQGAPPKAQQYISLNKQGEVVILTVGYDKAMFAGPLPAGKSLIDSAGFKAVKSHVVPNASFIVYVDVEQALPVIQDLVTMTKDPQAADAWPKIREVLGLPGVKQFVASSGFDGKDWLDHAFLHAPSPRNGLLALTDTGPLSDAAIKGIPATATLAGAVRLDLNKVVSVLKQAIVQMEPRARADIDRAIADASKELGMDVEKELVGLFGDEWAWYSDPTIGGRGMLGAVFVNRLRDPAKAEATLLKLQQLIQDTMAREIREKNVHVTFLTTKSGDTTIHYLGTPLLTPAWAIKDGYLVAGLYPQVVAGAVDHIGAGGKSLLDNPDYIALRKRLGATEVSSVSFADLPKTAPDAYATWVAISRLSGFGDIVGVPAPAMLLPPLGKLMPHLAPAGGVTWADAEGVHAKALSPFPGATLFASDPFSGGAGMMPALAMFGARSSVKPQWAPPPPPPPAQRAEPEIRLPNELPPPRPPQP